MKTRVFLATLLTAVLVAAMGLSLLSSSTSVSATVPYRSTPVADADLDGNPATGAWQDASSYTVPLENGESAPYGTAILYLKHDGKTVYFRIDGKIDVPWSGSGVKDNHFWLGFQFNPSTVTGHHRSSMDSIYFGETSYGTLSYPLTPIDTYGGGKPPTKDSSQDVFGALQYFGTSAPYAFTAEWKRLLNTGDVNDILLAADGLTSYYFYITTDSNGGGSYGGTIDHSVVTNDNILKFEPVPVPVHDIAVKAILPERTSIVQGESDNVTVNVENEGTVSESFLMVLLDETDKLIIGSQLVTLDPKATATVQMVWVTSATTSLGLHVLNATVAPLPGETDISDNWKVARVSVTLPFTLYDFPSPYVHKGVLNVTLVLGESAIKPGRPGVPSTIDVVGGVSLGVLLGRASTSGPMSAMLDTEAAYYAGAPGTYDPNQIVVTEPGNLMTIGGPYVNLVTRYYNRSMPVRFEPGKGVCVSGTMECFKKIGPYGQGTPVTDYGYASIYYEVPKQRFVMAVAGLSGYAVRGTSELIARNFAGAWLLNGTGFIVELNDSTGDGVYETFQAIRVVGGTAMTSAAPFPTISPFLTFILGESSAKPGRPGVPSTIDVVGGVVLGMSTGRQISGDIASKLDTEAAYYTGATGTYDPALIVVTEQGNLLSIGGPFVNLVTRYYNQSMPVRFEPGRGVCVAGTDICYKKVGSYGQGTPVTDYGWDTIIIELGREVRIVAGLSGYAVRGTTQGIAEGTISRINIGMIAELYDLTGDGWYEKISVVVQV